MGRLTKQLVIGFIFLALISSVGYGLYDLVTPDASCSDGIQNQGETGVDCGTVCGVLCAEPLEPLKVTEPEMFDAGEAIDVLVELSNPNAIYGAARVNWTMTVGTEGSAETQTVRRGFTYVNPLQTRYLVMSFPGVSPRATTLDFQYSPEAVRWLQADRDFPGVSFSVTQERLDVASSSAVYSGVVMNDSTFDFDEVDISVILLDASGRKVGVGATVVRTLSSRGTRSFTVSWPSGVFFMSPPVRAQVRVSTNVFNNANFIREYGGQERFQGF